MKKVLFLSGLCFALVAVFLLSRVQATPLFSVQASERCDSCHVEPDRSDPRWVEENYKLSERKCRVSCGACHVNPTGGMIRNAAGYYFGTRTLPMSSKINEDISQSIELIQSNKFISLGGDFRFMNLISDRRGKTEPHYFPMQADLYADLRLMKYVSFVTQFGLERGGNSAVREVFGLLHNLPYNGYLKLGKFIPPYGHRLEDHTAYIRTKIAFDQSLPSSYVSGIEAGVEPLVFFANVAYFNQDETPKNDRGKLQKGVSGIAGWRGLWLQLGGSFFDVSDFETSLDSTTDRSSYGIFGSLRLLRASLLFEYDFVKDDIASPAGSSERKSTITFQELNYHVLKGLNAKVRYETYDPDDDVSGDDLKRYMAGVDILPYPFIEFNLQYRHTDDPAIVEEYNEYLFMAHLWF